MEECEDFSLCGKAVVTEADLRDEYYWKLVADFIGAQSGEGLDLDLFPCKNRVLIQVGLLREDNNFPWIVTVDWLKKIFPRHRTADFRRLIERGIATTLSLGSDTRLTFLESEVNFSFVGPICDSIGVEREDLLEMRDFSERAQLIEVTNGLILELSKFVSREKISPVVIVSWLKNFNPEFCKNGNIQTAYAALKARIKKLQAVSRNNETRSHRRNAALENFLQSPFELVKEKKPKFIVKKRSRREEKVPIKEENENYEIRSEMMEYFSESEESDEDSDIGENVDETLDVKSSPGNLLDFAMLSVEKLSNVYSRKSTARKEISFLLLQNEYERTCKEHPAMMEFEKTLNSVSDEVSLALPVEFLDYNAHYLIHVCETIEQQIMMFEQEIMLSTGEKLGRDKLPQFSHFENLSESATSRFINMASDVLSPRSSDALNYRKHWLAFCEEMKNPSRLASNPSNQLSAYYEAAAGLIHHHKEIALFLSDLMSLDDEKCPNVILESVSADANDSMIQSFVCVVAIAYCKILGPYWQLLKSGAEYSHFSKYLLHLYQKFLDWSKDPVTLLEPEGATNVFLQFPLQEKTFSGVFNYCGQWHTNRDLIRVCLKRMVKAIASVTDEHLKDFLPGGKLAQVPPADVSEKLVSCTFSVLMAECPFSKESLSENKTASSRRVSRSSQAENNGPDPSSHRTDEASCLQPKKKQIKTEKEEVVLNMDRDYIIATVTSNGGPCKTQQDLDKMLLRFDGKTRAEKREAMRCEMLYQKIILNNPDPNLDCICTNSTTMALKLKMVLPRVKPSYSLVLAPKKTKVRLGLQDATGDEINLNEGGQEENIMQ